METITLADNRPQGTIGLTRQLLRQWGSLEIRARLREMFPLYSRKEIRQLAFRLHQVAWEDRDKEAVKRAMHP